MIETSDEVVAIQPAATVVLMREGESGPEVLLVQRSRAVRHMGGEWVFPGGKIDAADYPPGGDEYQAAINAAIRETAEEAGLAIDRDQLLYLSHWTTPPGVKRRFSAWFFLAILEDGQEVTVDGGEIANHRWVEPGIAFEEIKDTENPFRLMPPTFVSLVDLAQYGSCADARLGVGARDAFAYVPNMVMIEGGMCFLYDGDAGYADGLLDVAGPRHRTYMINYQLEYIRQS